MRRWAGLRLAGRAALAACLLVGLAATASADVGSRAHVQDDGTLRVNGKTVRLYGIYIPTERYTCGRNLRPARCAPRAVLALDFKIQGFVYCKDVLRHRDRSVSAVCRTGRDREDLAAYLLNQGWAVALPGAPFEYVTLERFAQANGRGFWGFQVDSVTRRRMR